MDSAIAQKAVELYGGEHLWRNTRYIEAEVSAKGWAFTLKRRPFFKHARLFMKIGKQFCKITPIGKDPDISGILDGLDVRLENAHGELVAERKNARKYFPFGRRLFSWDDLDMAYFANYAFWNYFNFPALLMNKEIIWEEKADGVLQAIFPDNFPTHNKMQLFHFDKKSGLLTQHDYTAEIISKYAKAANVILDHNEKDGLLFPSSRRVTPRTNRGKPLKRPVLVEIKIHNFKLTNKKTSNIST